MTLPKLRFVKFTMAKGHLYAYFNVGSEEGRASYTPLPKFGTDEFYTVYAKYLDARQAPKQRLFDHFQIETEASAVRKNAELSLQRDNSKFVYFIQTTEGQIKIGMASNITERMQILQIGHPSKLELLVYTPGGRDKEKAYHRQFSAHRLSGEWFNPHSEILAEIDRLRGAEQNGPIQTIGKPAPQTRTGA